MLSPALLEAADTFSLLGDPHRLSMLVSLLHGERCVGDLARQTGQSESAVSHALRLLRAHRVVSVRRAGRHAYYRLQDAHVRVLLQTALDHADDLDQAADLESAAAADLDRGA